MRKYSKAMLIVSFISTLLLVTGGLMDISDNRYKNDFGFVIAAVGFAGIFFSCAYICCLRSAGTTAVDPIDRNLENQDIQSNSNCLPPKYNTLNHTNQTKLPTIVEESESSPPPYSNSVLQFARQSSGDNNFTGV